VVTVPDTVDGKNPAPVDKWFIPLLKKGFNHPFGGAGFRWPIHCRKIDNTNTGRSCAAILKPPRARRTNQTAAMSRAFFVMQATTGG